MGRGNRVWGSGVSTISDCYAITSAIGIERVGGLVGSNEGTTISECYSTGSVFGVGIVGGLVGQNGNWLYNRFEARPIPGSIDDCYSNCDVMGVATVGGLVGFHFVGDITRCYSSGAVLDSEPNRPIDSNDALLGGLVGESEAGITDCFWDKEASGLAVSAGGTGKTTVQMRASGTFLSWGACGVLWSIDEGFDYPRLAWQGVLGQVIPSPAYGGGAGTAEDPYLIYTAEQLNAIGLSYCQLDKHFKLMADIDLSAFDGRDGRPVFNVIGTDRLDPFTGVFDGNGHIISHLTLTGEDGLGMFGELKSGAAVMDLGVVDVNISGSGRFVGALAGYSEGYLTRCYSSGTVSGDWSVGGLVGASWNVLDQCHSLCAVTGGGRIGGLVGSHNNATLTQCYSTGAVSGDYRVGGLVGHNSAYVIRCHSTGAVSGSSSSSVGGLVGLDYDFNKFGWRGVRLSFWDTETSGQTTSDGGTGKTTAEMQTASTFLQAGWDFVGEIANGTEDIWWILGGQDYPRLWWEVSN